MFVADGDDLAISQLEALFQGGGGCDRCCFLLKVQGNVAQLLLDVVQNFSFCHGDEAVAMLSKDLHEVVPQVQVSQVQTQDGMQEGLALIDRHHVGDPVV